MEGWGINIFQARPEGVHSLDIGSLLLLANKNSVAWCVSTCIRLYAWYMLNARADALCALGFADMHTQ